ncbi:hypothetical protein Tco_0412968 [Tanacetum coccineum]
MLLMQAQESGAVLDEEQSLFLAGEQVTNVDDDVDDSQENDLALNVDHIFEADECDAFDFDVDEGVHTSQTMVQANLTSEESNLTMKPTASCPQNDSNVPQFDQMIEENDWPVKRLVSKQNIRFILDSDMEGKNKESYKFPIAVQQSFNSLWSQDVRGDPDSGIGGHWRSSDSGMYKFILILRALAVFRFRRALAVFRFRHAFTKNGIACIYLEGPPHHDFSLMDILPGKSTSLQAFTKYLFYLELPSPLKTSIVHVLLLLVLIRKCLSSFSQFYFQLFVSYLLFSRDRHLTLGCGHCTASFLSLVHDPLFTVFQ